MNFKKPLTITEQIKRLQNEHNLQINDKLKAENILSTMNYFLIKGYGFQFLSNSESPTYTFYDGTTLEDIYDLFLFDNELRSALLSIIGITEKSLRTVISNVVSCNKISCSIPAYDFGAFKDINKVNQIISKTLSRLKALYLDDIVRQNSNPEYKCKSNYVIYHYFKYHDGKFPLWIILEFVIIGDLAKIYRCTISDNLNGIEADQIKIASKFNTTPHKLIKYIECINVLRNKCCHFNRIYGSKNLPVPPALKRNLSIEDNKVWHTNPLFSIIKVLRHLNKNTPVEWNSFVVSLESVMNHHNNVLLEYLGFPKDWIKILKI